MATLIFIVVGEPGWPGRQRFQLQRAHLAAGTTLTPRDFIEQRMSPLSFSVSSPAGKDKPGAQPEGLQCEV